MVDPHYQLFVKSNLQLDSPVKQVSLANNCPAPATSPQLHDATDACVKPKFCSAIPRTCSPKI